MQHLQKFCTLKVFQYMNAIYKVRPVHVYLDRVSGIHIILGKSSVLHVGYNYYINVFQM